MKMTDANRAWLQSEAANQLRKEYAEMATVEANALMAKAIESTDPNCRMHAAAYATWKRALKKMEITDADE